MTIRDILGLSSSRSAVLGPLAILIVCLVIAVGCTHGKRPFLVVQVCLPGPGDRAQFVQTIQAIGAKEHMNYVDRSAGTEAELKATDHVLSKLGQHDSVMNLGLVGDDGVGLGAGNLGLPNHQFAVGFSEGSNPAKARLFAEDVVSKLKQMWHVEAVRPGRGARGMKSCI